jgi:hypothetical protein
LAQVFGVQPQTFGDPGAPPPQVSGAVQLPQLTVPPQPSLIVPQSAPPGHVVFGVQHWLFWSQTSLACGQQLGALPEQKTPLVHVHAPSTQSGATSLPTQLWHAAPPVPHTAFVSPGWQVASVQQPWGQLVASQTQFVPSQRWPVSQV